MNRIIPAIILATAAVTAHAEVDYQKVYEFKGSSKEIIKKISASFGPKYSKEINDNQIIIRGGFTCEYESFWVPNSPATTNITVEAKDDRYRISFTDTYLDSQTFNGIAYPTRTLESFRKTHNTFNTLEACTQSLAKWADKLNSDLQNNTIVAHDNW
jgi:hypothetical protein